MRIEISERLRPFSHKPGMACLLPGTTTVVHAYPTRLEVGDEVEAWEEPLKKFTLFQDLEKGEVIVGKRRLKSGALRPKERLSLGNHKKQDWDLICRREDLTEILPLWFALGQWTPFEGTDPGPSLLHECQNVEGLLNLFRAGFTDMMVPTNVDLRHLGLNLPPVAGDPLLVLTEGARLIRSFFFAESDGVLALLPHLLPEFHCGRMTGVQWSLGELDLEWTKKLIRRVHLRCKKAGEVELKLQPDVRLFRKDKRETLDAQARFHVNQGDVVILDRFEK